MISVVTGGGVVDGQQALDLGEQTLDQSKVPARHACNGIEQLGIGTRSWHRIEPQLHPLTLDHVPELASAQRLELMDEANA
jgi:hypothetical protein